MPKSQGLDAGRSIATNGWAIAGWAAAALIAAVPVVCESLVGDSFGGRAPLLVVLSLVAAVLVGTVLLLAWQPCVRRLGNAGMAIIASIAGLQFAVSYAAQLLGYIVGSVLGPLGVFVDGLGSKGLSCLFLGILLALLPQPGALGLALATLFVLNVVTVGGASLSALLFVTLSISLHEGFAAALGITTARGARSARDETDWSFVLRVGLAIGLANAVSLYAQYALYELLLRLHFDAWYKISVSVITGLVFGGVGAGWGAMLGARLRRTAP